MKRWTIFTVIAVIVSVCLVSSYASIGINSSVPRPGMLGSRSSTPDPYGQEGSAGTPSPYGSASTPYGSPSMVEPSPLDPNKVFAAVRAFPGLEQELTKVGKGSRAEVAEWRRLQDNLASATAVDNRSRLGKEVQKQVALELGLLRKIAEEEGAKKTIAAIDGVLLFRQSRLEKLNKQMQDDRRSAATLLRSPRTSRMRGGAVGNESESSGRYTPSSRNGGQGEQDEADAQEENTTISKRRR
jgi:hypothetical protein